jgi:hypothetical protein
MLKLVNALPLIAAVFNHIQQQGIKVFFHFFG